VHAVWYPATAAGQQSPCACSLVSCHCSRATVAVCMQFGILPLQQGNSHRVHTVWYPATAVGQQSPCACSLVSCHCSRATVTVCMQFGILPLQQGNSRSVHAVWYPATAAGQHPRVHAVWYPATASDCRALVCNLRNCHCSRAATTWAPMQFENLPRALQPGSSHVKPNNGANFESRPSNCYRCGSNVGFRGRRKTYLTILKRAWSANFKMVWYVFLQPLGPELEAAAGGQNPQR
jgi:hypothetical protein